jgi:hypothetical protein
MALPRALAALLLAALAGRRAAAAEDAGAGAGALAALRAAVAQDAGAGGGALAALRARLGAASHLDEVDSKQLASLVLAQGFALHSLAAKDLGREAAAAAAADTPAEPTAGLALVQLAQPVPAAGWGEFEPALCARLQNFGGAEGFRAAYLGGAACGAPGAAAASDALAWSAEAALTLECAPAAAAGAAGVLAGLGARRAGATLRCALAVATDAGPAAPGAGALLHRDVDLPPAPTRLAAAPALNALRVRLCNAAARRAGEAPAEARGEIDLHGLRLNGLPLVAGHQRAERAAPGADACAEHLFRVPRAALAEAFVLSGWLRLAPAGGDPAGGFGPGEQASVELQLGTFSLAPPAALGDAGAAEGGGAAARGWSWGPELTAALERRENYPF